jgi:hypothetical protein
LKNEFKNHQSGVMCFKMQQKTDGRVVRLLTKHIAAEDQQLSSGFW